ncbi:MAG: RNA-guided endonuclease IscB [Chloroflexi bacterium]|nr:RNA-guided endonuclease IscB [Chloroflexota bacterium]
MESSRVFVVDADGQPLLPTHPARARHLLREGKASPYRMMPFTIQLTRRVDNPVGELLVSIDDGAKAVGIAVTDDRTQRVVFAGTIKLRQDVPRKMQQRAAYRRSRRTRKLRHRKARYHRRKGEGWLPPTIRQKKDSIVRVVRDLQTLLPIANAIVEQGMFDTSSLAAGRQLYGIDYQLPDYEGRDFREKVLWRDGYQCQHCSSRDNLQAHHIHPKAQGGGNTPRNGITLCKRCHQELHQGLWILDKSPKSFQYPAHLQVGKWYLYAELERLGLKVESCFGWMTRYWRKQLKLAKSHVNDAIAIACREQTPQIASQDYLIIPKRKKVWEDNPTKTTTEKHGFQHWDVVQAKHRRHGTVIGSIRSLKAKCLTLRTSWDDNFAVAYRQTRLLWRFCNIIYIGGV